MGERTCSIDDCGKAANVPGSARGWCRSHYYRFKKYGDPRAELKQAAPYGDTPCLVPDCDGSVLARGWCSAHYNRWTNHGHPEAFADSVQAHRDARAREEQTGHRFCRTCTKYKPLSDYGRDQTRTDGLRGECKRCTTDRQNARRAEDPQKWREYHRARYALDLEPRRKYARDYTRRNPGYHWRQRLRSEYGMTEQDWQAMRDAQDGRCLICQKATEKLVVDHCHATGQVRGLLCNWCNTSLGFVEAIGMERIGQYLTGDLSSSHESDGEVGGAAWCQTAAEKPAM